MKLTDSEKGFLEGDQGEAGRIAMEIVVRVGEAFGAERLAPVASAHILAHFGSLHQAGIDFLEKLVSGGGACRVPTTVDPLSVDFQRCERFRIPDRYRESQERLRRAVVELGAVPSWSCTPYHALNVPRYGQNIVWAESSAVSYANSVIGARTNRTPFGLDVSAAITGKVPVFGLYLPENRVGTVRVVAEIGTFSDLDYHTLGAVVGSRAGSRVSGDRGDACTHDQRSAEVLRRRCGIGRIGRLVPRRGPHAGSLRQGSLRGEKNRRRP